MPVSTPPHEALAPSLAPSLAQPLAQLAQSGYARLDAADLAQLGQTSPSALQALQAQWADLPPDEYLKDGGRYRRRRHGSWVWQAPGAQLTQVPHRPHWQPTDYNALHGGMLRQFEPLLPGLAESPAFLGLLTGLSALFAQTAQNQAPQPGEGRFDGRWFIEAHAFRIDTAGGGGGPPPPPPPPPARGAPRPKAPTAMAWPMWQ